MSVSVVPITGRQNGEPIYEASLYTGSVNLSESNTLVNVAYVTDAGSSNNALGSVKITANLAVSGDMVLATDMAQKLSSQFWSAHSDRRIKTDIRTVEATPALSDAFQQYRVTNFRYGPEFIRQHGYSPDEQIGLIADEVQRTHPQMVEESREPVHGMHRFKTVNPHSLFYEMVVLVQHHSRRIEQLEQEVRHLSGH
jgi:hypothetical protein